MNDGDEDDGPKQEEETQDGDKKSDKQDGGKKQDKDGAKKKGGDEGKNGGEGKPERRPALWPWIVGGAIIVVFVAVVLWRVFAPRPDVWTDDAYVRVHYATISPRVAGHVGAVQADDDQIVRAGAVLLALDPADFQTAVRMAEGALARDTAQVNDAAASVARQPALITEQEAAVASARARLALSQVNQRRYSNLAATGAGTTQQHQEADTTLQQDQASLQQAQAALDATRRQMQVLQAQQSSREGVVEIDKAQLEQARLNLSYTTVVAPFDGMIARRSVQVGDNVTAGAVTMTLVPLDQVYIEANYREVDLRHVRSGQHATIHVDAYDIDLDGIVLGVPAASGAAFSPIPPNNATGNFTKIVQRLPVRIVLAPDQRLAPLLRVGFSVETTIHTGLEDVVADQRGAVGPVTAPGAHPAR